MVDIPRFVLLFTAEKCINIKVRIRNPFPAKDTSGAAQPIESQFTVIRIDRAGYEIKYKFFFVITKTAAKHPVEGEGGRHIFALETFVSWKTLPGLQKNINRVFCLKNLPGEFNAGCSHASNRILQPILYNGSVVHGQYFTEIKHAKTTCPPCYLSYLSARQRALMFSIELLCFSKNNTADRKGNTHPDGIGCYNDICLSGSIFLHFITACNGRQGAVDYTCPKSVPFQMSGNGKNILAGKAYHGIMRLKILEPDASAPVFQRDKALMPYNRIRVAELCNQGFKNTEGFRGKADMHLLGINAADGFEPGRATLIIRD